MATENTQDLANFFTGVMDKHFAKDNAPRTLNINPEIHRLVLWINVKAGQEVSYTLRIGNQRFVSVSSLDKKGQTYWRFKLVGEYADGLEFIQAKPKEEYVSKENH